MGRTGEELVQAARGLRSVVAAASEQIDRDRDLPESLVRQLADSGIFGMGVPAAQGGTANDLQSQMVVIAEISAGNGSAGWIVMNALGAPQFAAGLDLEAFAEVFEGGAETPLAGAGAPQGQAVEVEGGYLLSGRWQFASGCTNAKWLYAGFSVPDTGEGAVAPRRRALIRKADARIIDTWQTVGLRGDTKRACRLPTVHAQCVAHGG